jgi:hypothetical protein
MGPRVTLCSTCPCRVAATAVPHTSGILPTFSGGPAPRIRGILAELGITSLLLPLGIYCQRGGHRWPPRPLVFSPTTPSILLSPPSPKLSPCRAAAGKMVAFVSLTLGCRRSPWPQWIGREGSCPQAPPLRWDGLSQPVVLRGGHHLPPILDGGAGAAILTFLCGGAGDVHHPHGAPRPQHRCDPGTLCTYV